MKGRCECGAGVWSEGDIFVIQAHDLDCPQLLEYVNNCPSFRFVLEGEDALKFFDAAGSDWIRQEFTKT